VAIDDAIPGWRIVIYLDGAVLIESYVPYVNAMLAIAIILIILSLASIMYSAVNIRRNIKDASAATLGHLLKDLLPGEVANKVITREVWPISDTYSNSTVMFCDMVNFTKRSSTMSAQELLILLNTIVERFDARSTQHHVEKVKTIGDCYMAVTGCPVSNNLHAPDMISFSLACIRELGKINEDESMIGVPPIQFRFGVNSGEVVGGVIGSRRFVFDIFGDTVNVASRMESKSLPMRIRVTEDTKIACQGMHTFVDEQDIEVKGKDHPIKTYLVGCVDTAAE
jgi:class 3 adenylate cyclase